MPTNTSTAQKQAPAANTGYDDKDELSQNHGSESSGMFDRQSPKKQVQHVRLPKVMNAKEKVVKEITTVTATRKVGGENEGKKRRSGRVSKIVDEEEEDFGKTESQ